MGVPFCCTPVIADLAEGVAALEGSISGGRPFPVLVQGQAPREALLNQFRELGNAVLLATGSFWEGVDVKGDALVHRGHR